MTMINDIFTKSPSPATLANIETLKAAVADSKQRIEDAWAAVLDYRARQAAVNRRVEEAKNSERNATSVYQLAEQGRATGSSTPSQVDEAKRKAVAARKDREAVEKELAPFGDERHEVELKHRMASDSGASATRMLVEAVCAAEKEQFAELAVALIRRLYVSRSKACGIGQGIPSLKRFLDDLFGMDVSMAGSGFIEQVRKEHDAMLLERYGLEGL